MAFKVSISSDTIDRIADDLYATDWQTSLCRGGRNHGDKLLYNKEHRVYGVFTQRAPETVVYTGFETITCILVEDLWKDGTGGKVRLIGGGVDKKYVNIQLESQRSRGFHFRVRIWGM